MQGARRSFAHRVRVAVVAVAVGIAALAWSDEASDAVYSRQLIVGDDPAVRERAASQARAHHLSVDLRHHEQVQIRRPPPACGLELAQHYRTALHDRFGVFGLATCRESDQEVKCPSEYLGEGQRLFLRLSYSYQADREMTLSLTAYQRDDVGDAVQVQLPRKLMLQFAELWSELTEISQCAAPAY